MNGELKTLTPEPMAMPTPTPTPMLMLQMAIQQGADLEKMTKLMDLQERWEANEARKAFTAAMTEFKQNPPRIVKDKQVAFGQTKYKHAELDQVSEVIGEALCRVGITHRWNVEQTDLQIKVTCVLTHSQGHSEQVSISAPPDSSGQKNAIQGIASAVSYLQRYTLLAASGTATGEGDNDGRTVSDMPEGIFQGHLKAINEAKDGEALLAVYTKAYRASANDRITQKALIDAKDKRKAELRGAK